MVISGLKILKKDLQRDQIRQLIIEGGLKPGPPPSKKHVAGIWTQGMNFLYWNQNPQMIDKVFTKWYFCDLCKWTHKLKKELKDGNSALRNHIRNNHSDKKEVTYSITASELRIFGQKATEFGQKYGSVSKEDIPLPPPLEW